MKKVTLTETGTLAMNCEYGDIELSCPISPAEADPDAAGCLQACSRWCAWFDMADEVHFDTKNPTNKKTLVSFVECKGVRIAQVIRYADKPAEEKLTSESGGDA